MGAQTAPAVVGGIVAVIVTVILGLVVLRALWDLVYCCAVSISAPISEDLGQSADIPTVCRLAEHVWVVQSLISSGCESWLQRHITKFSRMLVIRTDDFLVLVNPGPLDTGLSFVQSIHGGIGSKDDPAPVWVVATNCFHYLFVEQWLDAVPESQAMVPAGLLVKCPSLAKRASPLPGAVGENTTLFLSAPWIRSWLLPGFHEEHIILVESQGVALLWAADTLLATDRSGQCKDPRPSPIISLVRWLSIRGQRNAPVQFGDYVRQFFRGSSDATRAQYVETWRNILARPIRQVVTCHGVFRGSVLVLDDDIARLRQAIERTDSPADALGRRVFFAVLRMFPARCHQWSVLFSRQHVDGVST